MFKKMAVLVLVLVASVIYFADALTPVESAPLTSTVFGAITAGDHLYAFSFDGTYTQLGHAQVPYSGYQDFQSGAYLPNIPANNGVGLLIAWLNDVDPSFSKIRIFNTNGSSAGTLALPNGLSVGGASRFMDVNGNLFAQLEIGENSHFYTWAAGLYATPTEVTFPASVITARQLGYSDGTFSIGSGPNGRLVVVQNGNVVFEQTSNDNFRSSYSQVTSSGVFGEVDGSIWRISGQSFSWLRTLNDVQELAGSRSGLLLASTYSASGTGLVSYQDGVEIHTSQVVFDMNNISAAMEFGIYTNGTQVNFISLMDHVILDTFVAPENATAVQMTEMPEEVVYTTYLPMAIR